MDSSASIFSCGICAEIDFRRLHIRMAQPQRDLPGRPFRGLQYDHRARMPLMLRTALAA